MKKLGVIQANVKNNTLADLGVVAGLFERKVGTLSP